ncbi:MAG TPA: type ISP restriction/modification enzyme [Thermoanaerobaculia bacterium]|nr:type ISP restriction/modification enzyme [Thermoanaerobaculia bacterium]
MKAPDPATDLFLRQSARLRVEPREAILRYLDRIFETERREESREESFYPHLLDLFAWYGGERSRGDLGVTLIPRQTRECLLDFQVRRGERIAGYVEAKRPPANLDAIAESPQVRRYRATFPNLLLTNFRDFRLYRQGELALRAQAGALEDGPQRLLELLGLFVDFATPPSTSTATLAKQLALRTRLLAEGIDQLLASGSEEAKNLAGYFEAFSDYLLAGLSRREFADLYAQTLSYGLLAARWQAAEGTAFDRQSAAECIPASSGILREVFLNISLDDPPAAIRWIVDEIVAVLAAAPVRRMLERTLQRRRRDPVLDFYQTFLQCYDAGLRRKRGVYYTPPELVSFVVRSADRLLATRLGRRDGLADPGVTLLDPAAGTLTFVVEAVRCAVAAVRAEVGGGGVPALLRDHVLRDFHAFEVMMAPYAVGHLKMSLILEEMGHPLRRHERFPLYLTNALEDLDDLKQSKLPFVAALTQEAREAGRVKKERRITVILGNPPWSGHSANHSERIDALPREAYEAAGGRTIGGYYQVAGEPLGERNPKWLQDDYVKFLRFAQRKVDQAGEGIVAFVTNHSYLDNPTFRGLRRSLLETFDEIYLLDLHGSRKKRERSPDGSDADDANVFEEVRQGVAVAFLVKKPGLEKRVLRADLWGSRAEKLRWLLEQDVETTPWRMLAPRAPAFLFAPRDAALEDEYRRGIPLTDLFPERSVGIVTGRDAFAVDTQPEELKRRIRALREGRVPGDLIPGATPRAVAGAVADADWQSRFRRILFRPFDWRTIFYADYVIERPRKRTMRHMLAGENLGLIVPRQCKEEFGVLVADVLVAHKAVSAYDINTLFPLWLYPEGRLVSEGPVANLAPGALHLFSERLGEESSPEGIFQYVYAVLYSPPFRRRYADLLRTDFPRIPLLRDRGAFLALSTLGSILVGLHRLRSDRLDQPAVHFPEKGMERESFQGIDPEVWEYRVGGYRVLDRWLAARAERSLHYKEIEEFRQIAAALRETIGVERRIAEVWSAVGPD